MRSSCFILSTLFLMVEKFVSIPPSHLSFTQNIPQR